MTDTTLVRLIYFSSLIATVFTVSISTYLNSNDKVQLQGLFTSSSPYKDAPTAYWSLRGLSLLNSLPKDAKSICDTLKTLTVDSAESVFSLTEAASLIKCQLSKTASHEEILNSAIKDDKKISSLYFAYMAMKNLKMKVVSKDVNAALEKALNTEESPTSMAYGFMLAEALNMDLEKRYQLIEDVYAQADIVDNKYMQFEGGIFTTALVVEGSYKLAAAAKKPPTLKPDQVLQLANYLLSRKYVSKVKSACQLVAALSTLSSNKFHVPVAISLDNSGVVSSTSTKVSIRVSDVLGKSVGKMSLTADSGRHIADDAVVLSKKQLKPLASDASVFELDFNGIKAPFGLYKVQLTASSTPTSSQLIGLKGSVEVKVVTAIKIDAVDLNIADADQSTTPKAIRVNYPKKVDSKLDADYHQKLGMTFYLKSSSSGETVKAHQVFIRMTHKTSGQEIFFVALPEEGSMQYRFELDLGTKEKDFGSLSGLYDMALLVGDAVIENPVDWSIAEIDLTFLGKSSPDDDSTYKPKPVIEHMFRQPEKRPPAMVSNVFTVLCLSPLLIMFALWAKIGANISNFPMKLSAIGFHMGVAAIFALYFLYWTQLNMFETIKYLAIIAIPTFLCGNQLLSSIASKRQAEE